VRPLPSRHVLTSLTCKTSGLRGSHRGRTLGRHSARSPRPLAADQQPEGATTYLDADLRDTGKILREAAGTLDFSQPVAIMLIAVLHYIPGLAEPRDITARLLAAVAPGSFMTISHAGSDLFPHEIASFEKNLNEHLPGDRHAARPREDVALLFDGTTLLAPGVVPVSEWRPATADEAAVPTTLWGGVGRK